MSFLLEMKYLLNQIKIMKNDGRKYFTHWNSTEIFILKRFKQDLNQNSIIKLVLNK